MPNLVKLKKQLLAHHFQGANLPSVLLLREEHLAVASLANLSEDLKVGMAKAHPPLAEICTLATAVLVPHHVMRGPVRGGWLGIFFLECIEAGLAVADICKKVKVVVEEVCIITRMVSWSPQPLDTQVLHTELSDIHQPLDGGLLENLPLFFSQTTVGVEPLDWRGGWPFFVMVQLMSRECGVIQLKGRRSFARCF